MSIAKRLSRANALASNENNLIVGKLVSVEAVSSEFPDQNTGEILEIEQIEWIWEVPTKLGEPTRIYEWTGCNVNSEKTWHNGDSSTYNKLTTILIQFGLLSPDPKEIDATDLESLDIESLLNRNFEFEIEKRPSKKNIKSVKLTSLRLI